MKVGLFLFFQYLLFIGCNKSYSKENLFENKVSILEFLPRKNNFNLITPKITNNYFVAILSNKSEDSLQNNNYFIIIDLSIKKLAAIIENPIYSTEKYPLFDYANDSLRVVSFFEKKIYNINATNRSTRLQDIDLDNPYGKFSYLGSKSIFSNNVHGVLLLDNFTGESRLLDNSRTSSFYYSDFSKPFNDSFFLYGPQYDIQTDSLKYFSNRGWSFQIKEANAFEDNNFQIYYKSKCFVLIRNSLLTLLDAESGKLLFKYDFGFGQISSSQLMDEDLLVSFEDSTSHTLYEFNIPGKKLTLLSNEITKATHVIFKDTSFFSFEKNGVVQFAKNSMFNSIQVRNDLENLFNAQFIFDPVSGNHYYLDGYSIYW